jgi:cytoskeletal protein CcmA (bactofilin family)
VEAARKDPDKVTGDLNTPVFSVEEGGFFEGACRMKRNEAEVHTLSLGKTAAGENGR